MTCDGKVSCGVGIIWRLVEEADPVSNVKKLETAPGEKLSKYFFPLI